MTTEEHEPTRESQMTTEEQTTDVVKSASVNPTEEQTTDVVKSASVKPKRQLLRKPHNGFIR
jgi:hypothetical protein